MKKCAFLIIAMIILAGCKTHTKRIYLNEMDLSNMAIGWGSVRGRRVRAAGKVLAASR